MVAPIRVLLAESNPAIRHALQRLLRQVSEVQVVAVATDTASALRLAEQHRPQVAVLDVTLAAVDGQAILHAMRDVCPDVRIVAVGIYPSLREPTLADGACRFVLLDASRAEMVAAIKRAATRDCQATDAINPRITPRSFPG